MKACSTIQPVDSVFGTVSVIGHLQHNFPSFNVTIKGSNLGKVDCRRKPTIVAALQHRPVLKKDSYFAINDKMPHDCKQADHISNAQLEFQCKCIHCQYVLVLFSKHQILQKPIICDIIVQQD